MQPLYFSIDLTTCTKNTKISRLIFQFQIRSYCEKIFNAVVLLAIFFIETKQSCTFLSGRSPDVCLLIARHRPGIFSQRLSRGQFDVRQERAVSRGIPSNVDADDDRAGMQNEATYDPGSSASDAEETNVDGHVGSYILSPYDRRRVRYRELRRITRNR